MEILRKKRLIYLVNKLNRAGAEKQLLLIVKALFKKYDIAIVALSGKGSLDDDFKKYVPLYYFNIPSWRSLSSIRQFSRLIKFLHQYKADIIHSWLYHSNLTAAIVSFFLRNHAVIASERNTLFWTNKRHDIVYPFIFRSADKILVNSQAIRNDIEKKYGVSEKVVIIPNGIELTSDAYRVEPAYNYTQNLTVIGCVGRFVPQKRQIDVIEAARLLLERHRDLFFVFVGDGETLNDCKGKVAQYGIARHFLFTGAVKDVFPYLVTFDILIQASTSEGMPNVIMEAMLLGIPVVATDVGGTSDLIEMGVNGYLVTPHSISEIMTRIESLVVNEPLRLEFATKSKDKINQFSLERMVGKIESMYQHALQEKG